MGSSLSVIAPRNVSKAFDEAAALADWRMFMASQVAAGELAHATAMTYTRGMTKFLAWASDNGQTRIGPQAIRAWKAELLRNGYKPAGVNVMYAGVRAFFRWAVAEQGLAYDPTANVKGARRTKSRKHKRDPLSDGEVLRLLAQPDASTPKGKRDRALLLLMAYTGIRTIEAQRAKVGDLHTNGHTKLFVHGKGRSEADEAVYLVQADLLDAIYSWLAVHPKGGELDAALFCGLSNRNYGGPLTSRALRGLVKGYMVAAGIRDPRKTAHSLRHTVVTNLIRHNVPPTKIMTVTRHHSLDTLLNYAHEVERDSDPAEGYVSYERG